MIRGDPIRGTVSGGLAEMQVWVLIGMMRTGAMDLAHLVVRDDPSLAAPVVE